LNKKTLAAQASISKEQATRFATNQIASGQAGEATRARIQSGLGSSAQLSGSYSGAQARDLSKYNKGLLVTGAFKGDTSETQSYLSSARSGDTVIGKGKYRDPDSGKWIRKDLTIADVASGGVKVGSNQVFADIKYGGMNQRKAADEIRRYELSGQISQVNALYKQANDAAKAGDYDTADQLQAQADALTEQFGLNENFSSEGLLPGRTGALSFSKGDKYDPLFDTEGAAESSLGSPTGMLVGGVVNQARQMQDPNSAESMRFKDSLTSGALTAVEQGRQQAVRALGSQERTAVRQQRDMMMGTGAAGQTAKMAAIGARNAERFATQRADVEGQAAAARAGIESDAAKLYEGVRMDMANNAVALSSAWVNNESGVRDNFRQIQNNLVSQYVSDLFGLASSATGSMAQMAAANAAAKAAKPSTTEQIVGGVGAVGGIVAAIYGG